MMKTLITDHEIRKKVTELAKQITNDYTGRDFVIVGILTGSFVFLADLIRCIDGRFQVEWVRIASYTSNIQGHLITDISDEFRAKLSQKHVLIVEDIVDTGASLYNLTSRLWQSGRFSKASPASVRICTLLDKPDRREYPIPLDYVGFRVPDTYVVGYGMDNAGYDRGLSSIFVLEDE